MPLLKYFWHKELPNPKGSLLLPVASRVIASADKEVENELRKSENMALIESKQCFCLVDNCFSFATVGIYSLTIYGKNNDDHN